MKTFTHTIREAYKAFITKLEDLATGASYAIHR